MKKVLILAMVLLLSLAVVGCAEEAALEDGTYTGVGEGYQPGIEVEVVVAGGEISEINVLSHDESAGVSDPAFEQIPARIIENQSVDVDVVSGATKTSEGIIEAVNNALSDA